MFQRIIVPIDGSKRAWEAARVAAVIASGCDADLEIVTVIVDSTGSTAEIDEIEREMEMYGPWPVAPTARAIALGPSTEDSVGAALARHSEDVEGSMIVMSSSGHGRSAAVLGSVADDVIRSMFGPIIVVGPNVEVPTAFSGPIIVPVDGSAFSELSLPLAAAWGIAWGSTPWIVEVLTEATPSGVDVVESAYPHRLARALQQQSHHDVEFEILHGSSPARAIADFASNRDASMVMMSTHGRTGFERLTAGSVAASVVREANCPVVLQRPPKFALT